MGYLWGIEKLEGGDSLFATLLEQWDVETIQDVINFFWQCRDAVDMGESKVINRVLKFWEYCYDKLKKNEDGLAMEDERIALQLNRLTVFLSDLSGHAKYWLLFIIPYIRRDYPGGSSCTDFIKYLCRLADNHPQEVGDIFWKMIKDMQRPPDYRKEDIIGIVEKLYQHGENKSADQICEYYARKYAGSGKNILHHICDSR